ncbi:MAG: ssuE [Polaromonas sp.]|nr:ssuE [Polaromonas sp.]
MKGRRRCRWPLAGAHTAGWRSTAPAAVLQSRSARHILPGVYATDSQMVQLEDKRYQLGPDIAPRVDEAVSNLLIEGIAASRYRPA